MLDWISDTLMEIVTFVPALIVDRVRELSTYSGNVRINPDCGYRLLDGGPDLTPDPTALKLP